ISLRDCLPRMIYLLRDYYRRAVADIRYQGLEVLLWRIMVKLLSPLVRVEIQILFEYDLTQPIPERPARVECEIRPAEESEMAVIARQRYEPLPPCDETKLSDNEEYDYAFHQRQVANLGNAYLRD